jgi:hypothetical protein
MRFGSILTAFVFCLFATACAGTSRVAYKEDMLAASGFKSVPANTPARQQAMRSLPPHRFMREAKGGRVMYVYADTTICNCLYVGGEKAYNTYRAGLRNRQLDEQSTIPSDMSMVHWDWAQWAAGYPADWPYSDPELAPY